MSIQQSTELTIFVTHVEADGSFLKIWGQGDKNSATCVERMILPLVEQFARSQGCIGPQSAKLHINALCCARFLNEGYYRAKVVSIRTDGMVVLQFIDYGNVEVLPPQEIHLLENISGSEPLQSLPPVALDFTLMHVLPVNGVWENKIIESIKKTLWYNEYKILIHPITNNNHRFIKLWYNNEDFGELLIKKHMALGASLEEMFRTKYVQPVQVPTYQQIPKHLVSNNCNAMTQHCDDNEIQGFRKNVPSCCLAQQKHMMQTSAQEALVFKSRVLDVPSKHDVYVSFVEDGPQKFSVQLQSTSHVLSVLMTEINNHPIEPLQEPPLPGAVCLGRYTRDKVLCRAVMMSVMENKCKLYYVDFGHTEVLPYTDIFQLPPHFINPRVLSIRFTLSGVHELNVTDEMKDYFRQIVPGKLLVLHVQPPEGPPLVQYGDLYDNGKNIKDILRQAFPNPVVVTPSTLCFAYQQPRKLSKGMEEIVHVSFVESCKKFFVQLESSMKALELIMNTLADYCATSSPFNPNQLKIGLPCAALYDNQWYRAQILAVNVDNVNVLYVDYGNVETVPLTSLRAISNELVEKLPAQALKCMLSGWDLLPSTQEAHNQFESLILEKRLLLIVVDDHVDGLVVDLCEPEMMEYIKPQLLHLLGGERKIVKDASNYQSIENKYPTKISHSDDVNKWHKKNNADSWHQAQNNKSGREVHENRNERNNFRRNEQRNERSSKDDFSGNTSAKNKWTNRNEYNDSVKSSRGARGGKNKSSVYTMKSHSSDKSWSDKDSETSYKGSSRRERASAFRGGNVRREGYSGRTQSNKFSDREIDSGFGSNRTNRESSYGNSGFKDRRGQGHRLVQNRINTLSSGSEGEARRYSPMRNSREFHVPRINVSIGSTKTCEVVFTNNLSDFFIQLSSDYTALDSLMENIASLYENGGDVMKESEILSGVYCIAKYSEDMAWYRAVIKSVEGNHATVQFMDYGNTENVEFSNIKSIRAEFLKLPIQVIHCKLFGLRDANSDNEETKKFQDVVTGKTLNAEFIAEENGVHSVMLYEVVDGCSKNTSINEEFCKNADLIRMKENILSNRTNATSMKKTNQFDYAPLDTKWSTLSLSSESKKDVIITWFTNPNNFYCQILDNESEFRTMMNEIQKLYVGRQPISDVLQIGSPVIAIFSDDGALYRAEVTEINKLNGYRVQYIDFGNSAIVERQKIYPVEKKLMSLPKQAVHCSLKNIVPQNSLTWSKVNTEAIESCFNVDRYKCIFHGMEDNKYVISLNNNGEDVANTLVEKNIASFETVSKPIVKEDTAEKTSVISCDVEKVDINLLSGQTLMVKVSSVVNVSKFYIQLPSAVECDNIINTYMADKDPKVMQQLSALEICLGTGCLVYSNGVWRRAVINSHSESTGFDVKFIDTGVHDEIFSDSVLALPSELSVMQNQAVECSFAGIVPSPEADNMLKERVEGKEVIMYVDEVDNTRLIVKLFDLYGDKINILCEHTDEKVPPVCPMPISSSTHKVTVSYVESSANIWLQCATHHTLDKKLCESLNQYYSASGTLVEPKENLLCVVKSTDGHWYRAKIISFTETNVYVHFIDYGNNEEVTKDAVMALDTRFYVPHELAVNVSLPVTLNGTASEQLAILQNNLLCKELTAVFHNVNKKWVVELLYCGKKMSEVLRSSDLSTNQETSVIERPQIHNVMEGCVYNVYVSHIDSPSQFWIQLVEDATDLSNKQKQLQEEAPNFSEVNGIPEEGSLCVAVYTIDNLWYRAQVLDADEDITTVRFIDYGNTDVIDNKSGNIRQIPDSWKEMKEYAIKCRLDVIPIDSEDWNVAICEKFESLAMSVESLQMIVEANSVQRRVNLLLNDKSIGEILVEDNHALKVHTEEELIDEIVDLELDPHSAFVSHVNSPNEFWVQEEKSVGDLEVMTDRFIVAHMFPKVDEIEENLLCVAKYPDDECWYRARVTSHNNDITKVIYIDYGNSATSTEIRAIPADLADIPPLSRKCCLKMPDGVTEWSDKACEEFTRLAADGATIFLLDVLEEDETSVVKLTLDGKNITDILADFCQRVPPITEERLPPLGEENLPNVFVSHCNSPDEFWIQTESSTADLNMILEQLEAAHSFLPLNIIEVGTICAASRLEDGVWYRAKVLSQSENGTEVRYIDYGNTEVTNEIRMLPEDIANIPPLAKRCSLRKPPTMDSWPSKACKVFKELSTATDTLFQYKILDDTSEPVCVKLTLNGKNIVDILLPCSDDKWEDISQNLNATNKGETEESTSHTNVSTEKSEDNTHEMESIRVDTYSETNSVLELSVDDIVKNMKTDESVQDEEIFKSDNAIINVKDDKEVETVKAENNFLNSNVESYESNTGVQDKLEIEATSKQCKDQEENKNNGKNVEVEGNKETDSNATHTESIDETESSKSQVLEVENNECDATDKQITNSSTNEVSSDDICTNEATARD